MITAFAVAFPGVFHVPQHFICALAHKNKGMRRQNVVTSMFYSVNLVENHFIKLILIEVNNLASFYLPPKTTTIEPGAY